MLILRTQAAAAWLVAMSIGVTIAEIIAIVLVIVNLQGTGKLVAAVLVRQSNTCKYMENLFFLSPV